MRREGSESCVGGILLVLHVDINSSVMLHNDSKSFSLFSCCRWQKEGEEERGGEQREEEESRPLSKLFNSC